jgi:DNA topoisomerase 4 subunit A
LMSLTDGASLEHTAVISSAEFTVETVGRRGAVHQERLRIRDIDGKRGKKGKVLEISGRLKRLSGVDSV